jgi:hypothetical protein
MISLTTSVLVGSALTPLTAIAPAALAQTALLAPADAVAVGQGFNLNPSDLKFILKQIKIAEHHAASYDAAHPCDGLMGPGENQIPTDAQGEELPWGLRTVDGTCNNLVPGQTKFGAADQPFPPSAGLNYRGAEHLVRPPRQRRRRPAAHDQQPDRRPDRLERCRRGRRRRRRG